MKMGSTVVCLDGTIGVYIEERGGESKVLVPRKNGEGTTFVFEKGVKKVNKNTSPDLKRAYSYLLEYFKAKKKYKPVGV